MASRIRALWNAMMWTLLIGSAFIGIGGLGLEGAAASDVEIHALWKVGTVLAIVTFSVAFVFSSIRAHRRQSH
jgi:hypothetical protein